MISSGKVFIICYLIFSPAVLSFTVPASFQKYDWYTFTSGIFIFNTIFRLFKSDDDVNRQGVAAERQLDVPDNILEVAAVGFAAGLAGQIFS